MGIIFPFYFDLIGYIVVVILHNLLLFLNQSLWETSFTSYTDSYIKILVRVNDSQVQILSNVKSILKDCVKSFYYL